MATLVLCTVDDPARALGEAARVLAGGGWLLFLEHVRAEEPRLARWQDRLHRPWRLFGNGCNCNRPTPATLEASSLTVDRMERDALEKMPPIVRPIVTGRAMAT